MVIEAKFDKQIEDMHRTTAHSDEQIAFLTAASEHLKRRVREVSRNLSDEHKSLALEKDQLEARLARTAQDLAALPPMVEVLSSRVELIESRRPGSAGSIAVATPEVPVVELLRQMVQDAVEPEDTPRLPPSASGTPRFALPVPVGPTRGV